MYYSLKYVDENEWTTEHLRDFRTLEEAIEALQNVEKTISTDIRPVESITVFWFKALDGVWTFGDAKRKIEDRPGEYFIIDFELGDYEEA